jgi:hypothetical protein
LREGICNLLRTTGIRTSAGHLPRVHDFRHYADSRIMPNRTAGEGQVAP